MMHGLRMGHCGMIHLLRMGHRRMVDIILMNMRRALNINFIRTPPIFIRTCTDEYGNPIP